MLFRSLHVHDLVDWVCEESRRAGRYAAQWLKGEHPSLQIRAVAGTNVRYVNPAWIAPNRENHIYLRSMVIKNDAVIELRLNNRIIHSKKERYIQPSEMISLKIGPRDFMDMEVNSDPVLEFSIH